jgi:UPF0271 protein
VSDARRAIDVNCDLGEVPAQIDAGIDDAIATCVTSINIACGGHAGDDASMSRLVEVALRGGTRIGAHPSYPDRANFGRARVAMAVSELRACVCEQVSRLRVMCQQRGAKLTHVKPHGALYHDCRDERVARAVAEGARDAGCGDVVMVGQAGNDVAMGVWREMGFDVLREAFADRWYERDGTLTPRSQEGAMLASDAAAQQAVMIARDGVVRATTGELVNVACETICVHGDGDDALVTARLVMDALAAAGISVRRGRG